MESDLKERIVKIETNINRLVDVQENTLKRLKTLDDTLMGVLQLIRTINMRSQK